MTSTQQAATPSEPLATFLFDQMDILSHLFFATGNCDNVVITWPEGRLDGTFRHPDGTRVLIGHSLHQAAPAIGTVVFVEYQGPSDRYRFFASVIDLFRGEVVIAFPEEIECSDRRLRLRLHVPVDSPVRLFVRVGEAYLHLRPLDLSDGGLAVPVSADWPYGEGDLFEAFLDMGEANLLAMRLEVRHRTEGPEAAVVGARLVSMSLSDRARLARFLVSSEGVSADYVD